MIKKFLKYLSNFENFILLFFIFLTLLLSLYALQKIFNPIYEVNSNNYQLIFAYLVIFFISLTSSILFLIGLIKFHKKTKLNISIVLLSSFLTFYTIEIILELRHGYVYWNYDWRTKTEVINDIKLTGLSAYPNWGPSNLLKTEFKNGLKTEKGKIFPLSGMSDEILVATNENGFWMTYKSDQYGFHNKNNIYDNLTIDILMVGDSFTEGYSVKSAENIGGVLLDNGYNVINLGKGGNSALIQYAGLKEYGKYFKPKIVLWFYYENDLIELNIELQSNILNKYIENDNFSQNLIFRQNEINSSVKKYMEKQYEQLTYSQNNPEKIRERNANNIYFKVIKLSNLRKLLNKSLNVKFTNKGLKQANYQKQIKIFSEILKKSNKLVSEWDGKMYFIFLPEYNRYLGKGMQFYEDYDMIIKTVNAIGIPLIDIHQEVFSKHNDPFSLFPFRRYGHYNSKGYKIIADKISEQIQKDKYLN